jgi:DNA repair protein RadD
MRAVIPDVGVWSAGAGEKRVAPVTVVSIHSADSLTIPDLKLIICDEAHNLNEGRYASFLARHPQAKLVGFTATPWRDGVEIFGEGRRFPRIHYQRGLKQLIKDGFLVQPVSRASPEAFDTTNLEVRGDDYTLASILKLIDSKDKIKAQVTDALPRLDGRSKIAWMCASIEHAERVASEIAERGESVAVVHSKNPKNDYAMECFERGATRHMVSVMMLSEGYDFPAIDAIVLMRPCRSPTLMVQTIGRGLRPYPGKSNCLVLDYGEVVKNCGPVHDPFTRERREKAKKDPMLILVRVCRVCLSYVQADEDACPDCGHEMKQERDETKNLTRRADDIDLLREKDEPPEELKVKGVSISRHTSKAGKPCVKLSFDVEGRVWPVHVYGSEHPFSWGKFSMMLYKLTPFYFESFKECYENCETLVLEAPDTIIVKQEKGFDVVTGIFGRAADTDIPF